MNAVERHAELLEHGWTTRADGLMRPPAEWGDHRVYSRSAAWDEHTSRSQIAKILTGRADRQATIFSPTL
jgi:hypothetical protein